MLRKLIIKWLFNYSTPQYFEAIQFYKNIQWETVPEKDKISYDDDIIEKAYCYNGFKIVMVRDSVRERRVVFHVTDTNNPQPNGYGYQLPCEYPEFILKLHDIIHFGILMPKYRP